MATRICLVAWVVLVASWLAPATDADAAGRARLLRVVTPKDGRFVADHRRVRLKFTVRSGTRVRAVMLNGTAKRRLTRLVRASG